MIVHQAPNTSGRVLVVVRGHLGDLVQALPALRNLRRAWPKARITLLLNEYVAGALEGCPYIDEVLPGFSYQPRSVLSDGIHVAKLALRVARRFDVVVGLRWSPTVMPMLAWLSGASCRVGYDRTGRFGALLSHNLGAEPIDTVSNRVLNQLPLRALGIDVEPSYSPIDWLPGRVITQTAELLASAGISIDDDYCLMQLSAHWGCSEWSSEKWAELADYIARNHGLKVAVTGTSEWFERAKFEAVRRRCTADLVSLLGKTSVPQLFEVVRRARLVIAGDSGVAQIALAQRTPSVVLFGIEEIEANGPLPGEAATSMRTLQRWDQSRDGVGRNPHCEFGKSYCHGRFCTEDASRRNINVADVAQHVDELLMSSMLV